MNVNDPGSRGHPVMFMSYAHHDDGENGLSKFRERLLVELRSQTGKDVLIFKDDDIGLGEPWRDRLNEGLATSTFLLPIITPSFLTSSYCRDEFDVFSRHEEALARKDLILPIYYIDCGDFLNPDADAQATATLRAVLERQYFDWRELRLLTPAHQSVRKARNRLATKIREALTRAQNHEPVPSLTEAEKADREASVEGGTKVDVAKRILSVQLRDARKVLQKEILDAGEWPAGRETGWRETWGTYEPAVVHAMGNDYEELADAFKLAGRLQDGLKHGPRKFNESDPPFLDEARDAIERGIALLTT